MKCRELQNKDEKVKTYSLFQWTPGENNALSALIVSLKGVTPLSIWMQYAELFLQQRILLDEFPESAIIIPCPSRNKGQDHAFLFAMALSKLTQFEVIQPLLILQEEHFRGRSRRDRIIKTQNRLSWSENITQKNINDRHLIFIDDVITTGSTVLAAHSLFFHKSSGFEAWSLAHRTR